MPGKTLITLLEEATSTYSDHVAIVGQDFRLTYSEFSRKVETEARWLLDSGINPGDKVGICLPRSPEMVTGIWSILRCGAAYVPTDPDHPSERIRKIYQDAGVRYVLTSPGLQKQIENSGFTALVNSPGHHPDLVPDATLAVPSPETSAYVLFTSGSTGTPKGVEVSHRSVVNLMEYMQDTYPIRPGEVILLKSPYTFDGSIWELFGWMLPGGCLHIAPPLAEKEPGHLTDVLISSETVFTFFVPAMLEMWLQHLRFRPSGSTLPSLRWVSVGGEVLKINLIKEFYHFFPAEGTGLINVYGPTETTVYATTWLCTPDIGYPRAPIGIPVAHARIYILDEHFNTLPEGEEGEIYIAGPGVAKGYLNQPDLTAERFLPDPFHPGETMYKTGDLGRKWPDGPYDYTGRIDFQVKLRGLRIELGEIERAITDHVSVREAVVNMVRDPHGTDILAAFIQLHQPENPDLPYRILQPESQQALKEHLTAILPAFMIPSVFVEVAVFRLTAHGKTDRKSLPDPFQFQSKSGSIKTKWSPDNETEKLVGEIWQQLLNLDEIGSTTHFFRSGGHSLKAVQAISLLQQKLNRRIPLQYFYDFPVLRDFSSAIQRIETTESLAFERIEKKDDTFLPQPLTPEQREMWILHQTDPGKISHNIVLELKLTGHVDPDRFSGSLKSLVRDEPVFNTVFELVDGVPRMIRQTLPELSVSRHDLHSLSNKERQERYEIIVQKAGSVHFSLDTLPLFRFELIHWEENEWLCLFVVHHLIFDGWSLQLFISRLRRYYQGLVPDLPSVRHGDYHRWLDQDPLTQKSGNADLIWWKAQLPVSPSVLHLPRRNRLEPIPDSCQGERHWFYTGRESGQLIRQAAADAGVTPFVFMVTALRWILMVWSKERRVIIGTPLAKREDPRSSVLMGYYTNMLPLLLPDDQQATVTEILKKGMEVVSGAFNHATLSYGDLVTKLKMHHPALSDSDLRSVFLQVVFVMQNWPEIEGDFGDFRLFQREIGNRTYKADLMLNAEWTEHGYVCWFEYNARKYSMEWIRQLADDLTTLLQGMAIHPDAPVGTLLPAPSNAFHVPECIIAGEGSLPSYCVKLLMKEGVRILGLITTDHMLEKEAGLAGIPVYHHPSEVPDITFDLIFSLNNPFILKDQFLKRATTAINYHDSLLPDYAGLYATSYAILNRETRHGVVFHQMESTIDTGRILARSEINIKPGSTAEEVNLDCFEAAMNLFSYSLPQWLEGVFTTIEKGEGPGSYFGQTHRPDGWGIINPEHPVSAIKALFNACSLGWNRENPFLVPSVFLGGKIWFLTHAQVIDKPVSFSAGTIFNQNEAWCIALNGGYVIVHRLSDGVGSVVEAGTQLIPGSRVVYPDPLWFSHREPYFRLALKSEATCKNLFTEFGPTVWKHEGLRAKDHSSSVISVPDLEHEPGWMMAATLLWLLRLNGTTKGWIGYRSIQRSEDGLFLAFVPMAFQLNPVENPDEAIRKILGARENALRAGVCSGSIFIRYPAIRHLAGMKPSILWDDTDMARPMVHSGIVINTTAGQINLHGLESGLSEDFRWFISQCQAHPETAWTALSLVTPETKVKLSATFSTPLKSESKDIVAALMERAGSHPDATAISADGRNYTYQWLLEQAQVYAHLLTSAGVSAGDVVAIETSRTPGYVAALWGILCCGAAFMPVGPDLPLRRQEAMASAAKPSAFIRFSGEPTGIIEIPVIMSVQNGLTPAPSGPSFVPSIPGEETPAYVIFTSGSTGLPKGVIISRKALNNFTASASDRYRITENDRVMQFANLSFDTCIEEIFPTLTSGAVLILRNEEWLDFSHLSAAVIRNHISVLDLPTGYWRQWIRTSGYPETATSEDLRMVILGGEALRPTDLENWNAIPASHSLINSYGPTETTVVALTTEFHFPSTGFDEIPIGTPIGGVTLRICDEYGFDLPPGSTGELQISGNTTGSGYCNSDSKGFQFADIGSEKETRVYHTGDLVRADADGLFYFCGRKDHQVKIRGFRVEPQEVQKVLSMADNIGEVVVEPVSRSGETISLAACWTGTITEDMLRTYVRKELPAYMEPEFWLHTDQIPLTPYGKTDTAHILQMIDNQTREAPAGQEPETATEHFLHDLWCSLLGRQHIGIDEDFFVLGGHSLIALQMVSAIHSRFGKELPLATLLVHQTIRKLAACLVEGNDSKEWSVMVPIRPEGDLPPLFLIHGAGLNVMLYESLKRHIPPGRPLFALQARGLSGREELQDDIVEIATDYLSEIRKVQPRGPYYLIGFSAGGFIVFEMAGQLLKTGEEAAFTGMIDSAAFHAHESHSLLKKLWLLTELPFAKTWFHIMLFGRLNHNQRKQFLVNKMKNVHILLNYLLLKSGMKKIDRNLTVEQQTNADKLLLAGRINMFRALRKYRLHPEDIHIDLFRSADSTVFIREKKDYGWGKYALKGITMHSLPGDHSQIFMPPNDKQFANILEQRLSELNNESGIS